MPGLAAGGRGLDPETGEVPPASAAEPVDLATVQKEFEEIEASERQLPVSRLWELSGRISRVTLPDDHDNAKAILYARFAAFVNSNWKRIVQDVESHLDPRQRLLMGVLGVPWSQLGYGLVNCWETDGVLPILRASYRARRQGQIGEAIVKLGGDLPIPDGSKVIELIEEVAARQIGLQTTRGHIGSVLHHPISRATNETERRCVRAVLQHLLVNGDELVVNNESCHYKAEFGRAPRHFLLWGAAHELLKVGKPADALLLRQVYARTGDKAGFRSRVAEAWGEEGVRYLELPLQAGTPLSEEDAFGAGRRPLDQERAAMVGQLLATLPETRRQNDVDRILEQVTLLVPYGHEPSVRAIIEKADAEKTIRIGDKDSYVHAARIGGNMALGYCRAKLEEPLPADHDPNVDQYPVTMERTSAARALGVLGHPSVLPLLRERAADAREFRSVRHQCEEAIKRIEYLQTVYEISR